MNFEGDAITIQQPTDTAEARRLAIGRAARLNFEESEAGKLGIVVTEISKNVLKHAAGGEIFLRTLDGPGAPGVEVLALDKGPGIADIARSFQDGYSTAGSCGTGLGAIVRMSDAYDVYSRPGQGTALMAQVCKKNTPAKPPQFRVGGVSRPIAGEPCCGDAWIFQERAAGGGRMMVADGLGHGVEAAAAARASVLTAQERLGDGPTALLERIHGALRSMRGAAVAVAEIDSGARVVRFAGIGNISGVIIPQSGPWLRMVSQNGTAGLEMRKLSVYTYPWPEGALLLMHTDGLSSNWSFDTYPGLPLRHPSLIGGVLYRDYTRGRDDVTVVAAREEPGAR